MSLESTFRNHIATSLGEWVAPDSPHYASTLDFALGRFEEGRQLAEFFKRRGVSGRVLDIGAGNGGVSLAMADDASFDVTGIDVVLNREFYSLRKNVATPAKQVTGTGHALPFASSSFDVVLCLETIEHVPQPELLGPEIMRVLKPGGLCMITTPPRLRYWFRRDPHYAIPGLLVLPDPLQHWLGARLLPKRESYDVVHIFWHVREITRLLGDGAEVEVLWNHHYTGPTSIRERLWWRFRHFLWDRIVVKKLSA